MNPPHLPPLLGADEPSRYSAHDHKGQLGDPRSAVVPIIDWRSSPYADFRFIGTGFFIAQGVVATARHVIEAFDSSRTVAAVQMVDSNTVSFRRVHATCIHQFSDVGILRVLSEGSPEQRNRWAVLSRCKPLRGTPTFTIACANTKVSSAGNRETISVNYEFFRGKVVEQFPTGRDKAMLTWPCYQVDYHLHPGASGGPTFNPNGSVFAINCASHDPHTDIAYVTSVDMLLGCELQGISIGGKHYETAKVSDLIDAGIVIYEE